MQLSRPVSPILPCIHFHYAPARKKKTSTTRKAAAGPRQPRKQKTAEADAESANAPTKTATKAQRKPKVASDPPLATRGSSRNKQPQAAPTAGENASTLNPTTANEGTVSPEGSSIPQNRKVFPLSFLISLYLIQNSCRGHGQ